MVQKKKKKKKKKKKEHIHNRRTNKEETQLRNRLGTVSRKTTEQRERGL